VRISGGKSAIDDAFQPLADSEHGGRSHHESDRRKDDLSTVRTDEAADPREHPERGYRAKAWRVIGVRRLHRHPGRVGE
jgi:hypothetical protein